MPAAGQAEHIAAAFGEIRVELLLLVASLAILGAGWLSVDAALLGDRPRVAKPRR